MNYNRLVIISLLFLLRIIVAKAQELEFTCADYDMGTILEKRGEVYYDFKFKNSSNVDIIIKDVIPDAGCTAVGWKHEAYKPGEDGIIRIIFHPQKRTKDHVNLVATVYTNLPNYTPRLTIKGNIVLANNIYPNKFRIDKAHSTQYKAEKPKDDFERILAQYKNALLDGININKIESDAAAYSLQMNKNGSWGDIDYKCRTWTEWEPLWHLERLSLMATAYVSPKSKYYGNSILFSAIVQGIKYWNKVKPHSENWWYMQIGAPKTMASILALMEYGTKSIPNRLKKQFMTMMDRGDASEFTGANQINVAIHHIVRGCVQKNNSIVSINANLFFSPIKIADHDGIMPDMSFQQHGSQLYIGGYGTDFVSKLAFFSIIFEGTQFQMSSEKKQLLSNFVRKTYINVLRGGYIDYSTVGREISRRGTINSGMANALNKLSLIDYENKDDYQDAIKRMVKGNESYNRYSANQMFSFSDYMLHNRPKYDFSVRAVSNRTLHDELMNGENLYGRYLADGAYNIRIEGDEYFDIFPVWEWDKIPGTTAPEGEELNPANTLGKTDFVGGVSDGKFGVMTYDLNDYGIKCHKSWFMFDDEIVCLGSGLDNYSSRFINTSVNQANLSGDIYIYRNGNLTKVENNTDFSDSFKGWVWHDNVGYYFPIKEIIHLRNQYQTGSWSKINYSESDRVIKKEVFNLWINHGQSLKNEKYQYYIVPGITPQELINYDPTMIRIISNTRNIQAVWNRKADILQAVFYKPGSIRVESRIIEVSEACVFMIRYINSDNPIVYIQDPTRNKELRKDVVSIK